MARKAGPKPPTVKEILNMSHRELSRMNEKELRAIGNVLVSAGNKRIRRLERNKDSIATEGLRGVQSYSTDTHEWSTRYFSVKGKDRNFILSEVARARRFFNSPLSTVKAATEERQRREKKLFGETREERTRRLKRRRLKGKGKDAVGVPPDSGIPTGDSVYARDEGFNWKEKYQSWKDYYNSPDWDPNRELRETYSAFDSFYGTLTGGYEVWRNHIRGKVGALDSKFIQGLFEQYFNEGLSPMETGIKAAEYVGEILAQEQGEQEFYEID